MEMRSSVLEKGAANAVSSSDGERRRPGAVGWGKEGVEGAELRRGADRPAIEVGPRRESGTSGGDERPHLREEPAQRALIVAVAVSVMARRRAFVVDLHAQERDVAEGRLEIRDHRRRVRVREFGRRPGLVIGDGDELYDKRARR